MTISSLASLARGFGDVCCREMVVWVLMNLGWGLADGRREVLDVVLGFPFFHSFILTVCKVKESEEGFESQVNGAGRGGVVPNLLLAPASSFNLIFLEESYFGFKFEGRSDLNFLLPWKTFR